MERARTAGARKRLKRACARLRSRLLRFAARRKLVCAALFAGAGCLCAGYAGFPPAAWGAFSLAALFALVILRARLRARALGACLALVFFVFAGYAAHRDARPQNLEGGASEIEGAVCADPLYQPDMNRTLLVLSDASRNGRKLDFRVRVYVYGKSAPNAYEYGQRIRMEKASVWVPDGQTNPYGFDFASYLWRGGVGLCASSSAGKAEIVSETGGFMRALFRLKRNLAARIDEMYPQNADVMRALLLGDRSRLSDETYEDFKRSGIAHLIALSGLHVSCLALLLQAILRALFLPRRACMALTCLALCLYAHMTGMSPSILRAVFMYFLYCAAKECGYPSDLLTRLAGAFLMQLAWRPLSLADAGMQLSYASILGLAALTRLLRSFLARRQCEGEGAARRLIRWTGDALCSSLAAQLSTLPLVSSLFFALPALSLPVNLFAIPLGLAAVYAGAVSLMLHPLLPALARAAAIVPEAIWSGVRAAVREVSRLDFAVIAQRAWPLWAGIAYFACVIAASGYFRAPLRARRRALLALPALWLIVLLLPGDHSEGLRVTFLDAGYADSAVLDARGAACAIDCGRDDGILADYLTASGARLETVFVTHPDVDHAGGLRAVLARYPRARVYLPECWPRMDVDEKLAAALENASVTYLSAGDEVLLAEGISASVLWPEAGFAPKDDNDGSLVLCVRYGNASALFMGDLTSAHDAAVRADCDLLKVAHHGSKYASGEAMLAAASPALAVISVSGNAHGHPTPEVLERLANVGARVMRTDLCGAVIVEVDPTGKLDARAYRATGE